MHRFLLNLMCINIENLAINLHLTTLLSDNDNLGFILKILT